MRRSTTTTTIVFKIDIVSVATAAPPIQPAAAQPPSLGGATAGARLRRLSARSEGAAVEPLLRHDTSLRPPSAFSAAVNTHADAKRRNFIRKAGGAFRLACLDVTSVSVIKKAHTFTWVRSMSIRTYVLHTSWLGQEKLFFGHLFFNITNVFCAKQRVGHTLYMPQDGH